MRTLALMLVLAAAAGCNESHGPMVAGIDGNTSIRALTPAQWQAFCEWDEDLRGDGQLFYACDPYDPVEGMCVGGEMPPCYDWRASACLSLLGLRGSWSLDGTPGCEATVSEVAACEEYRAGIDCWRVSPQGAACDHAYCRDRDAGPADDGG